MHGVTQVSQTTSHQSAHMITEHETFHRLMREKIASSFQLSSSHSSFISHSRF